MDIIIDGIESLFGLFYRRTGKILFGEKFKEDPKSLPLGNRVIAGGLSLLIATGIVVAIWFAIALALR